MAEEKLRDELLANQEFQRDLFKWKLILAGAVLAVGLGLNGTNTPYGFLALGALPFIVAYCDMLIRDCDFKVALLGLFLLNHTNGPFSKYEQFIASPAITHAEWWLFKDLATLWASAGLCAFVGVAGIVYGVQGSGDAKYYWIFLLVSGALGVCAVIGIDVVYNKKRRSMTEHAARKQMNQMPTRAHRGAFLTKDTDWPA